MTVEIEIGINLPEEQRVTLTEEDIVRHNPVLTHTGKGDFTATIRGSRALEPFAQRQDRFTIAYSNGVEFTGYLTGVSHSPNSGTTKLRGDGIGKRLEETRPEYDDIGGPVSYSNVALHDALRDYWPRTPFSNFTVTDQDTELVADNQVLQDPDTTTEWENRTSIGGTEPFYIEGGEFRLAQSLFLGDAADSDSLYDANDGLAGSTSVSGFVDGEGRQFNSTDDYLELNAQTLNYDISEENVGVAIRWSGSDDPIDLDMSLIDHSDGSTIGTVECRGGADAYNVLWDVDSVTQFIDEWTDGDIPAGDYRFRIDAKQNSTDAGVLVDLVCFYDTRYSYNFDNSTDSNDQLSGPALYPDSETIQFDSTTTSFNIVSADITSTWDSTNGTQEIAISNDDGDNWTRASNTDTLSTNFSTAGRVAVMEVTMGRWGSRTDDTPTEGFNGHAIDSYNLAIDGNDLVVLVDTELTRNHFDNLKQLHDFGDFLWVIEHDGGDIEDMTVSSFRRGEETRSAPFAFKNPKNKQPEIQSGTYYNSIYLEGAKDANGDRPSAEVKDQDAIDTDGREISPGVLRDLNISTESGASYRARALLNTAQSNNNLVGSVTTPPVMTDPGYAREIDLGDGLEEKTVEEVSLTLGNNSAEARFDFSVRSGFSEDISNLKRNSRDIGNQV